MTFYETGKLTDLYEELIDLKEQGKLSFAGERELKICEYLLYARSDKPCTN